MKKAVLRAKCFLFELKHGHKSGFAVTNWEDYALDTEFSIMALFSCLDRI